MGGLFDIGSEVWSALGVSLVVAGRAVLFALPLAVLAAWLLARGRFPGRTALDALVHAPAVLPPVAVGFGLLLLFGVRGPIGAWLQQALGVRLVFTSQAASLAAGVMAFPLMVRSVRLSLEAADPGLEIAARSLGAATWDRLFSVTLPLALPGIAGAAVTGFAACLGEFGAVITFAGDVPGETRTLPIALYAALQTPGGEGEALRLALIALAIAIAALIAADLLDRRVRAWTGR